MLVPPDGREAAAARLRSAVTSHRSCAPVRDLLGTTDIEAAYAVASANIAERITAGRRRIGRKIGLTSPVVQRQLGVDRPDFGTLLDDMLVPAGTPAGHSALFRPRAEAEVAFVLGRDLDDESVDPRQAVAYALAAIEIVDSRITDWDITIVDTIADNASSALFALGSERVPLDGLDLPGVQMELELNGVTASTGTGEACLGDPLNALAWLAATARDIGEPLRAGEIVLSGALGPMVDVGPGDRLTARLTGLGVVDVQFTGINGGTLGDD
jgi:2-keto-4-pentenoate hydratase